MLHLFSFSALPTNHQSRVARLAALSGFGIIALLQPLKAQSDLGVENLTVKENGTFVFDGVTFSLIEFGPAWERMHQTSALPEDGYPQQGGNTWETKETMAIKDSASLLRIEQRMTSADTSGFDLEYRVSCSDPKEGAMKEFSLEVTLPAKAMAGRSIILDGTPYLLPPDPDQMALVPKALVTSLHLPSSTGEIVIEQATPMSIRVEDLRAWSRPNQVFSIRIKFRLTAGALEKATLNLKLRHLSTPDLTASIPNPTVITADSEWAPYVHSLEIEPGSVFDFSFLIDAPAGKYGALVSTPDGQLEFANRPDKSVRFWGVNLSFQANFLEKADADKLAARLAASGYNAVRIHHYDAHLVKRGERTDTSFDPDQLDKLDYLFAALRRQGIYIETDLFTVRSWYFNQEEKAEMGISNADDGVLQYKALVPVSEAAMKNWENFSRTFLTHRNPYTGLTWAEDPALIGICPVNEDVISEKNIAKIPVVYKRYKEAFEEWWNEAGNREKSGNDRDTGYTRFIYQRRIAADEEMHKFLRSIGVKALLTGANFQNQQALVFQREHYDIVENHQYWALPKPLPGQKKMPPMAISQANPVAFFAECPRGIMQSRIWGKPYIVTEFNFVSPNQFRAAGGILMPSYASLQGWNGIYNFEYASGVAQAMTGGTSRIWSLTADPIGLLADRVSALIFRRGDIAPAQGKIGFAVQSPDAFGKSGSFVPEIFTKLGLVSRIGMGSLPPEKELSKHHLDAVVIGTNADSQVDESRIYSANEPGLIQTLLKDRVLPSGSVDEANGRFTSDTGQIELCAKMGTLKVVTDRSELLVLPKHQELSGSVVSAKNGDTFAAVSVVSVDGKPLRESGRILILHLTDALATGTNFGQPDRSVLEKFGELPFLVKSGETDLALSLADHPTRYQAWVVDSTGHRLRETALKKKGSDWLLPMRTASSNKTQLAYEIVRL